MHLYRFAWITSFCAFLLIIAGGLVTSTDSGLAVPDWPLSFGTLFPKMEGGVLFEHSHRLIAAGVGMLTLILTLWTLKADDRAWICKLALIASGMVVVQGLLGGLTVLFQLPTAISASHGTLGQLFFTTLVILTSFLAPDWEKHGPQGPVSPQLAKLSWITAAALVLQLILGALVRHAGWHAHLLVPHIIGAVVVLALLMKTLVRTLKEQRQTPAIASLAKKIPWLLLLQIGLGFYTLITGAETLPATAHVGVGALLLATTTLLSVRLHRAPVGP